MIIRHQFILSKKAMLAAGTMSALVGASQGAIVEMWDFEEGQDGARFNANVPNGAVGSAGTLMQGWNDDNSPTYTSDTLSTGGRGGSLAMNVNGSPQDGYVNGALAAGSTGLNSMSSYSSWSIELNANFDVAGGWVTMVGRQRSTSANEADLYFQRTWDNYLRLSYLDAQGNRHVVQGATPLAADSWYGLAASADSETGMITLYVDNGDGSGYYQDGQLNLGTVGEGALSFYQNSESLAIADSTQLWTFGRGQWAGGNADFVDGQLDNIAFHDQAVDFTGGGSGFAAVSVSAIPEPSGVLALGLLFGASMLTRRR